MSEENIAGIICGTTKTTKFDFEVKNPALRKSSYISIPHKEGTVLAKIIDIEKKENKTLKASAEVVGYRDEQQGFLQTPHTPFEPGDNIFLADEQIIRAVLNLPSDGIYIGLLQGHNLPIYLNIDQKHIAITILAKMESGKSYASGVLVEELIKKNIPIIIIDTHGEYISLTKPNNNKKDRENMDIFNVKPKEYSNQISIFSPLGGGKDIKYLTLDGLNLEAQEIIELFPTIGSTQKDVLHQAIAKIKKETQEYAIHDIIKEVKRIKSTARWNVITILEQLNSIGFSEKATTTDELVKRGQASIIYMVGIPFDNQKIIMARLTTQLVNDRKAGKIPPFLLIVDEAHNYCPERSSAVSSNILRTIASEGRHFGIGLCVICQRPAKIDKNIISQCTTHIILKVTNPNDLDAITHSIEGLTSQSADEIQRLPTGVAIISDPSIQIPITTRIRIRETEHGGRSMDFRNEHKPDIPKLSPYPHHEILIVYRVLKRRGAAITDDPYETIQLLSETAEKKKTDPFSHLLYLGKNFCHEQNPPDCIQCPENKGCPKEI